MPQPLSSCRDVGMVCIGNGDDSPKTQRPDLALNVADVLATHSIMENFVTLAFMELMGANQATKTTVAAIFNTIRSSSGQRDALNAATAIGLDGFPLLQDLCYAVFEICRGSSRTRNVVAHWVWGHASGIPDGVLLVDPTVISSHFARLDEYAFNKDKRNEPVPELDPTKIMVYKKHDFDAHVKRSSARKI